MEVEANEKEESNCKVSKKIYKDVCIDLNSESKEDTSFMDIEAVTAMYYADSDTEYSDINEDEDELNLKANIVDYNDDYTHLNENNRLEYMQISCIFK